jgi:hypothetical protein
MGRDPEARPGIRERGNEIELTPLPGAERRSSKKINGHDPRTQAAMKKIHTP